MEKSRAIELLEHLAWDRDIERNPYGDALNMAIEALKAQLSQEGTTKDTTSDLISRQAAIDALARMMPRSYTPDGSHPADEEIFRAQEVFADCIEALEILPPAQLEPREGHWIPVTNGRGGHECDRCHEYAPSYQSGDEHLSKYCPNCGAKMKISTK